MLGATRPALSRSSLLFPVLLFAAAAAFTVWHNTQVAVLVDLAYPLNTATRIAAGDVPYRDFPLAHAPLHFLVQAALIKLLGPNYLVQIAYAAILGGVATVLTYAIGARLLEGAVRSPRSLAALLTVPLVPLGVYSIYPHPFYDPDACIAVLVATLAVLVARSRMTPRAWLVAGALLTIPVLVKQNIGGAFLILAVVALSAEALARPETRRCLRWGVTGLLLAAGAELLMAQLMIGLEHVLRWTWAFAMTERGVSLARIAAFADPRLLWPAALLLMSVLAARAVRPRDRAALYVAILAALGVAATLPATVLAVPELFPPILIAASVLAVLRMAREGPRFGAALPLLLAGTTVGALQSQGLPGSTYGIFPILVLALVCFVRDLALAVGRPSRIAPMTAIGLTAMLFAGGAAYTLSEQRLDFIDVHAPGPVVRSTFPTLTGLSARGPYVPDLDRVLEWARDNVPPEDPMVFLPGEDPAFYALGRRPRLPSVYFFDVANPVSLDELVRSADDVGLRWVFVKDRLQLTVYPPIHDALVAELTDGASLVARVGPYRVYRRP